MGALSELDSRVHRLGFVDVKLLAVSAFFAGFVIAKLFPEVLSVNVWLFILVCAALAVHPMRVLLRRDGRSEIPSGP